MAAAKAHWERLKPTLSPAERETHPARWVLAELVNLHDESICFEAVHRLLLDVDPGDVLRFLSDWLAAELPQDARPSPITICRQGQEMQFMLPVPEGVLPVTVLQNALDAYLAARPQAGIDFIHGTDTLLHLADAPGRIGFVLPDFPKAQLFPYVMRAACCRARPSQWVRTSKSATIWRRALSAERRAPPDANRFVKSSVFCYNIGKPKLVGKECCAMDLTDRCLHLCGHIETLTGVHTALLDLSAKSFLRPPFHTTCALQTTGCTAYLTHLYGAYEAERWDGKYIYYCPRRLVFTATPPLADRARRWTTASHRAVHHGKRQRGPLRGPARHRRAAGRHPPAVDRARRARSARSSLRRSPLSRSICCRLTWIRATRPRFCR